MDVCVWRSWKTEMVVVVVVVVRLLLLLLDVIQGSLLKVGGVLKENDCCMSDPTLLYQ